MLFLAAMERVTDGLKMLTADELPTRNRKKGRKKEERRKGKGRKKQEKRKKQRKKKKEKRKKEGNRRNQ